MDPEFAEILRRLPENVRQIIELILGGARMRPRDMIVLVTELIAAVESRELIIRALLWLVRLGHVSPDVVIAAHAEVTAAEAGAAAGAGTAATVAAVLAALLAVIFAGYMIYGEYATELKLPDSGTPCGLGTREGLEMATVERTINVRAIGTRTSLNKAISEAQKQCDMDSAKCKGDCGKGKKCLPRVSVQSVEQWYRVFYTATRLVYRCPCSCVDS